MMTLQHAALSALAIFRKMKYTGGFEERFKDEIPWILLPDALRFYTGNRYVTHFERALNGECAWIAFPSEKTLTWLDKSVFYPAHVMYGIPKYSTFKPCAIGEEMQIREFDKRNYDHPYYHALRIHMQQDIVMDEVVRGQLVDVSGRFEDRFLLKYSGKVISGEEFRYQIAKFEEMGFMWLVGKVYTATGVLLDRQWYKDNVLSSIEKAYSPELAANTWKYMAISDELDYRIKSKNFFWLTQEEFNSYILSPDLIDTLNSMYSEAYLRTFAEL